MHARLEVIRFYRVGETQLLMIMKLKSLYIRNNLVDKVPRDCQVRVRKSVPAPHREAEKNLKDTAFMLRSSAPKGGISTNIIFHETAMRLIFKHRRENENPTDLTIHSEFDPMM